MQYNYLPIQNSQNKLLYMDTENAKSKNSIFNHARGNFTLENTPNEDSVEISKKNNKKKIIKGIAIGVGIAAITAGAIFLTKKINAKK